MMHMIDGYKDGLTEESEKVEPDSDIPSPLSSNEKKDAPPPKEFEPFSFKTSLRVLTKPFQLSGGASEWKLFHNFKIAREVLGVSSDLATHQLGLTQEEKTFIFHHDDKGEYDPLEALSLKKRQPDMYKMIVKPNGSVVFMTTIPVTGSDLDIQRGKNPKQVDRTYRHIETLMMNKTDLKKITEGIPIYSCLIPSSPAYIIYTDKGTSLTKEFMNKRSLNGKNMTETVTISPQPSLIENEKWQDEDHLRFLKSALAVLRHEIGNKPVNLINRHPDGTAFSLEERVKIIETLTHSLGNLFSWSTNSCSKGDDGVGFSPKPVLGSLFIGY